MSRGLFSGGGVQSTDSPIETEKNCEFTDRGVNLPVEAFS